MFCKYCGKPVEDGASFCPNCGTPTNNQQTQSAQPQVQPATSNGIAVVGFILSFFIGIAGLICSIIGLKRSAVRGGEGRGLSIAGIVISSIHIAVIAVIVLYYLIAISAILAIVAAWGAG